MKVLELPLLDQLLAEEPVEPFPYTKTFEEAKNEPFCFLHTSGSTGLPKPIPWSHGLIGTMDAVRLLPPIDGDTGLVPWSTNWNEGDRIYSTFPMSHVSVFSHLRCNVSWTDLVLSGCRYHHEHPSPYPHEAAMRIGARKCSAQPQPCRVSCRPRKDRYLEHGPVACR
jgi:acyl-CoA synthetase (AMP-forming)/AMP-acid ligase II